MGTANSQKRAGTISIIVPAHNSARTLGRCLAAVNRELAAGDELIVVDDASKDDSAAVAAAAGARVIRAPENLGAGRARNLGAREAGGDLLLFLDADVILQPGALGSLREAFARGEADAIVGHYAEVSPAPGFFSQYQNFYTFYNHDRQEGVINWFWTAIGAVKSGVFRDAGGFSEYFRGASAEDMQLGYELSRAGRRIELVKEVRGAHDHHHTFGSLVRNDLKKSAAWANVFLRLNRGGRYRHGFTGMSNRIALAAAYILLAGLCALPFYPIIGAAAAALAAAAFVAANASFYGFIARKAGAVFLLGAVPFHYFTNLLIGIGATRGVLTYLFGGRVR